MDLTRGDVAWADLGDGKRRPYVVVTRSSAAPARMLVTVAPITTRERGLPFEAPVPVEVGLPKSCVVNTDAIATAPKAAFGPAVGRIDPAAMAEVDAAIHYALDLTCPNPSSA